MGQESIKNNDKLKNSGNVIETQIVSSDESILKIRELLFSIRSLKYNF